MKKSGRTNQAGNGMWVYSPIGSGVAARIRERYRRTGRDGIVGTGTTWLNPREQGFAGGDGRARLQSAPCQPISRRGGGLPAQAAAHLGAAFGHHR